MIRRRDAKALRQRRENMIGVFSALAPRLSVSASKVFSKFTNWRLNEIISIR
jgi:hypothetical protein